LVQCRYTEIAQRIFKYSDMQYISLTPIKAEEFDIQNAILCQHTCTIQKLETFKNNQVFDPPCTNEEINYCRF